MARLILSDGTSQRTIELVDAITVAGRSPENKIAIEDKQCSRRHCQFEQTDYGYKLVDLESRNGTRVNDRVVNQALLRPGDRVQIGRHSLTFEDPNFKEPPAEIAARFAPPPPIAIAIPAEPVPAPTAAEVSKRAAAAAVAAAPAPAPVLPAAKAEPPLRRRTGHTTSLAIERTSRLEQRREKDLLTKVGIGAGAFLVILVVLILIPSGESPGVKKSRDDYDKAVAHYTKKEYYQARDILIRIPADDQTHYAKAQSLIKAIDADLHKMSVAVSEAEKNDFDALYQFCESNRANPNGYPRMRGMCEDFRQKYPKSLSLPKIEEYLKIAMEGQKSTRNKDLVEAQQHALDELKKNEFALSLRRVKATLAKFGDDVEASEKLVKLKDRIEDEAKTFYQKRHADALDLKARGKKDEATRIYEEIIRLMGDGTVDELADYSRNSRKWLDALK